MSMQATVGQVINGIPTPMVYQVTFDDSFIPPTYCQGTVTACLNGAMLTGVYNYVPASQLSPANLSFALLCTAGGTSGPRAFTATIFNAVQCDQSGKSFSGRLQGIPPFASVETFSFDFTEGVFLLQLPASPTSQDKR